MFLSLYSGYEVKPTTGQAWVWFIKELVKKVAFVDTMNACGGVDLPLYSFLTLAIDGQEWSALLHSRFTPSTIDLGVGCGHPVGQVALENRKFFRYYQESNQNSSVDQPVAW
jgi:hypothetical protein